MKPSANGRSNGTNEPEEAGWDEGTDPIGVVKEFPSGREIHRSESPSSHLREGTDIVTGIAYPRCKLEPKDVRGAEFKYQKVFGEDQFIAGGVLYLPIGGSKPPKYSKDNSYVSAGHLRDETGG